jgi:hypothetical protein
MRCPTLPLLVGLAVLAGCGGDAKQAPKQRVEPVSQQVDTYHCTISLARKAEPTVGEAVDVDPVKAKEAAWVAACANLPEAGRPDCHDVERFKAEDTATVIDGKTTHRVSLTPVVAKIEGKAELKMSKQEACDEALLRACAAAGEKGDCVASGAYTPTEVVGTKKTTVSEPQ